MKPSFPVRLVDVTKNFKQGKLRIAALFEISLEIQAGEFVAVMGASGSGKSTLLHAIASLTEVDSGQVIVANQDVALLNDRLAGSNCANSSANCALNRIAPLLL